LRRFVHRVLGHPARGLDVAGPHLHNTTAVAGAAHHLIGDAEGIHDIECGSKASRDDENAPKCAKLFRSYLIEFVAGISTVRSRFGMGWRRSYMGSLTSCIVRFFIFG
jgi:hypothetical protein